MEITDVLFARHLNGGGGGDITVESLSVTSNGTYTAPSGKAYTPVTVSVQPPANSYQLKSITTPTPLATFEASAMPMPSLKVSVEAKQDLHGYDKPWVGGAGKQMLDTARFIQRNGYNNLSLSVNGNVITFSGYTSGGRFGCFNVPTVVGESYTMKFTNITNATQDSLGYIESDTEPTVWLGFGTIFAKNSATTITATKPWLQIYCEMTDDNTTITNLMVERGLTASPWEPYSNICPISGWSEVVVSDVDDVDNPTVTQTTTITLPQTVYGGEVDVVNGILKITDGYIASYNGETLPSTWISSMDVYAEGTSPTTGAEVCYELANSTTISLTPTLIKSLNGTNNLSVDCGEVIEGEYFKAL